jgi:4-hydroxy-tetrahydrodipicolinate synthase
MDVREARTRLKGILAYTVTPFQPEEPGRLNLEGLSTNLRFLVDRRVHGVVPCGGTGEYWSLSDEEYAAVVGRVRAECPPGVLVIPGIGGSVHHALAQARLAEELKCDAVMVFTPQGRISEAGHLEYLRVVAGQTRLAVMPYLIAPTSIAFLEQVVAIPNVAAVKDATGDLEWFRRAIRAVGPRTIWLCEGESLAPYYLLHGAEGITSGVANFVPRLAVDLFEAARRGDFIRAGEIQRLLDPWAELRRKPGNHVPVVKAALDRFGLAGGPVRLPLLPLGPADLQAVERLIEDLPAAGRDAA